MSNKKKAQVEEQQVEAQVEEQQVEAQVEEQQVEAQVETSKEVKFDNLEWLKKTDPTKFFLRSNVSSKFDVKREPEVQFGLKKIVEIMPDQLPLSLVMLAKWWEVKPARAAIKKIIDAEAEKLGYDKTTYMQNFLRKKVDELNAIKGCIERLSYTITYFKPRKDFVSKVPMKQIRALDGEIYQLPVTTFNELKEKYAGKREELSEAIINLGEKVVNEIDEL